MKKFKCPKGKTIVTVEDIRTRCVARCGGYEQFLKCLKDADRENKPDEVVLEPSTIYLGFDDLDIA